MVLNNKKLVLLILILVILIIFLLFLSYTVFYNDSKNMVQDKKIDCQTMMPSISITPDIQTGREGTGALYSVSVKNHNFGKCAQSIIKLDVSDCPANWICKLEENSFLLKPGEVGLTKVFVQSSEEASAGNYSFIIKAINEENWKEFRAIYFVPSFSEKFAHLTIQKIIQSADRPLGTGSIISSPAIIDCAENCSLASYAIELNETIILKAISSPDSFFGEWKGDCLSVKENECEIKMDSDKRVGAVFYAKSTLDASVINYNYRYFSPLISQSCRSFCNA